MVNLTKQKAIINCYDDELKYEDCKNVLLNKAYI